MSRGPYCTYKRYKRGTMINFVSLFCLVILQIYTGANCYCQSLQLK